MHPRRGRRRKRPGLSAKIGGLIVARHVHGQGGHRLRARVAGYEYDEVGVDLFVDPVLVDQPAGDLVKHELVAIRKRPPPALRKQGSQVIADVYPRSIFS